MAAVIPFLERPDDPSETKVNEAEFDLPPAISRAGGTVEEPRTLRVVKQLQGLGRVTGEEVLAVGELTAEVLDKNHAELTNLAWVRKVVSDRMGKLRYQVVRSGRHIYLALNEPIGGDGEPLLAWNPPASPGAKRFKVLSWTSKMATPSFSLPAGAPSLGGSCPGATAGQTIVPAPALIDAAALVKKITQRPVRLQQTICGVCYATGGQYATSQVQFAQVLRFAWAKDAASDVHLYPDLDNNITKVLFGPKAKKWVEIMVEAIQRANYYLEGKVKVARPKGEPDSVEEVTGTTVSGETKGEPEIALMPERHPGRFFRIHDSGDWFSIGYLAMWKAVADALPDIRFWGPTRIWATDWGIKAVNLINGPAEQSNLIIRPSAYHMNEAPVPRERLGPGWSAGSSSVKDTLKPEAARQGVFDWDCRTYAITDKKLSAKSTCRHAEAPAADGRTPSGELGCRACWLYPEQRINYTVH